MAARATQLLEKIARGQLKGENLKILDNSYRTPLSYTDPALFSASSQSFVNSTFYELNDMEKMLREENSQLMKKIGDVIDFDRYAEESENPDSILQLKKLYDDAFSMDHTFNLIPKERAEASEQMPAELVSSLNTRIAQLVDTAENDINPLLNPLADFWTYQLDGPEFADVFAARPQWLELINRASDDQAFEFEMDDPSLTESLQTKYQNEITEFFSSFKPTSKHYTLMAEVATGRVSDQLLGQYHSGYLVPHEDKLLAEWNEGATLALRNTYVSGESDPVGHDFHH